MRTTVELEAVDRLHLWHPFTQQRAWCEEEPPLIIERAEGTNLYDSEGNAYIDGVASLWCNVHGHRHAALDDAVADQLGRMAHSTMLGLSHPPGIELAARLVECAPARLSRVFYSDSGATAVEVALKMAFQWWSQRGETERTTFVCLENAYHGDTLGAVSVGGIDLFHACYRPLLFDTLHARAGDHDHLAALLRATASRVAAVIVEPLVQGAAGMLMQPDGYLAGVRRLCDEHDVLLICDEVATGFGRTGTMFAIEQSGVVPDLVTMAKSLAGGLPLAAVVGRAEIMDAPLPGGLGGTYAGNPLACAAALAQPAPVSLHLARLAHWQSQQLLCALTAETPTAAQRLAAALKDGAAAGGFRPDLKPFQAHVTLARKVMRVARLPVMRPVAWSFCAFALVDSRTESAGANTTPEELLAAAHASCYAMAFAATLARGGTPPERLDVRATAALDARPEGGFKVSTMDLTVRGRVPGLDQQRFAEAARQAEQGCPISNAIRNNVQIRLHPQLES